MDTTLLSRIHDDAQELARQARDEGHQDAEKALRDMAENAGRLLKDPRNFEAVGSFAASGVPETQRYTAEATPQNWQGRSEPSSDRAENP